MATNRYHEEGNRLFLVVGSGVSSGDPVVVGQIPGVALDDADSANSATVQTDGVFNLAVVGETTTPAAIGIGDIVYHDTDKLNADNTNGIRFGYALDAVGSGDTTIIRVKIGY